MTARPYKTQAFDPAEVEFAAAPGVGGLISLEPRVLVRN